MIKKDVLYGVVVWYNPSAENIKGIGSYINHIKELIIIDNSDINNSRIVEELAQKNIRYVANCANHGIATALNQGCKIAYESGAQWVLTMDQDSIFADGEFAKFIDDSNKFPEFNKVGIFSPAHNYVSKGRENLDYSYEESVMTSGNIVSLNAFNTVGGFLDYLFIDSVDFEFCHRLTKHKYLIIKVNTVILNHSVGNRIERKMFGIKISYDDHSIVRQYYIARNALYLGKLHPEYKKQSLRTLRKQFKRLLLYNNTNKWIKIKYMAKGIYDYNKGVTGRLETKK